MPITSSLVALAAPVVDNPDVRVQVFLDKLSDKLSDKAVKSTEARLDDLQNNLSRRVQAVTYHAEAILMGLAHSFSPREVEETSRSTLKLDNSDWAMLKKVFSVCAFLHSVDLILPLGRRCYLFTLV